MQTILDNLNVKEKCQHFTPPRIIGTMLEMIGYTTSSHILNKKILENSFGNGDILIAIVQKYIKCCIENSVSTKDITKGLSQNLYGIELDIELYKTALKRLRELIRAHNLPPIKWNLFNADALLWRSKVNFDYIIGNPPYIAYQYIDSHNRAILKKHFTVCAKGRFDYCYAFIESAINQLSPNGKLVQLVPNNIYKNVFADELRQLLKPHITEIKIYPTQRLFKNTLTSASVFLYENARKKTTIKCTDVTNAKSYTIPKKALGVKWILSYTKVCKTETLRFGDIFKAASSVATLLNSAFIIDENQALTLENTCIRIAVSPKSIRYQKKEFIIFPYHYKNGKLYRFNEKEFQKHFPAIVKHLKKFWKELNSRASDSSTKWFEYGRSQALQHMNTKKLLLSTIVTNEVRVYYVNETTIPYSGIYIIQNGYRYNLSDAKKILTSEEFFHYAQKIGINVNGKSVRITCQDINNFRFPKGLIYGTT